MANSKVPEQYRCDYFFHFTDIRNLESIIKHGLLCTNVKNKMEIGHHDIANENIQNRRAEMDVTCGNGGKVHDYVPFYFSSRNPMLLSVLMQKNQDQPFIIYFCLKLTRMEEYNAVFTNASANTAVPPIFYTDYKNLDKLDWDLIKNHKWSGYTDDEKHQKMAEVLIHEKCPIEAVDKILVFNNSVKQKVQKILAEHGLNIPVITDGELSGYHFYYTKLMVNGRKNETLVMGPLLLKWEYDKLIKEVIEYRNTHTTSYKYSSVEELIEKLDVNFCELPETTGIYQLQTSNEEHTNNVSDHTLQVVENIKGTEYYKNSNRQIQALMVLAAYLHDIGKGPASKWKDGIQPSYPDHPYDAIPMLRRMLTEDIATISDDNIRRLCLMVVYHDLIGGIRHHNRKESQLFDVVQDEQDIYLLVSIYEADSAAVNGFYALDFNYYRKGYIKTLLQKFANHKTSNP